jgi:steroid 5-alpha reductase family enzyme
MKRITFVVVAIMALLTAAEVAFGVTEKTEAKALVVIAWAILVNAMPGSRDNG